MPPIPGPEQLFKKLFVDATEQDKDSAADRFALQNSILDVVQEQAHDFTAVSQSAGQEQT